MSKILIDRFGGNVYAALADGGKLLEFHIEDFRGSNIIGNIYKGRVVNIINGMQAAFVNIGLQKNAYLYVGDMRVDKNELDGCVNIPEKLNLKIGDEIMVQAMKEHSGNKGVRVTAIISIAGRFLVYMPSFDFIGVSRKITDEKLREKLTKYMAKLKPEGGGFIVRTAAAQVTRKELAVEAEYLKNVYDITAKKYSDAKVADVVYEEDDLPARMIRDVYTKEVDEVMVADKKIYERLSEIASLRKDNLKTKIKFFDSNEDLFKSYGLSGEIDKLLRNKVVLDNGAYLIIDKTEALTVIDVNTGKYIGSDSLEETVFMTNLLAAKEIARQVRLRNISGIIVVDFIDMDSEQHRAEVLDILKDSLKSDRTKCNVIGMTGLGLVEFTRKKTRKDISSFLLKPCVHCSGEGRTFSDDYIMMKIRSDIVELLGRGYDSVIVELNVSIANYISERTFGDMDRHTMWENKRIYLIPHKTFHEEQYTVRGENSAVLDLPENARLLF